MSTCTQQLQELDAYLSTEVIDDCGTGTQLRECVVGTSRQLDGLLPARVAGVCKRTMSALTHSKKVRRLTDWAREGQIEQHGEKCDDDASERHCSDVIEVSEWYCCWCEQWSVKVDCDYVW